jgi:hypothetical protein
LLLKPNRCLDGLIYQKPCGLLESQKLISTANQIAVFFEEKTRKYKTLVLRPRHFTPQLEILMSSPRTPAKRQRVADPCLPSPPVLKRQRAAAPTTATLLDPATLVNLGAAAQPGYKAGDVSGGHRRDVEAAN